MRMNSKRCVPPGLSLKQERNCFLWGLLAVSVVSLMIFALHYSNARALLFDPPRTGQEKLLIPGAVIAEFSSLLIHVFDSLFLLILCLPFWVGLHYAHYRRGSMSIYLMRRLPDQSLLHRQCWTLPLLGLAAVLLTGLLLLGLYFLIYRCATPAQCLPLAYRRF